MTPFDVIVVGAGPAGLFCAIQAAREGLGVLLLEKNPAPGKKLLISGSGHCNITHDGPVKDFLAHYGKAGDFLKPALMTFSNTELVDFFEDHGLGMEIKEGENLPLHHAIIGCSPGAREGM